MWSLNKLKNEICFNFENLAILYIKEIKHITKLLFSLQEQDLVVDNKNIFLLLYIRI